MPFNDLQAAVAESLPTDADRAVSSFAAEVRTNNFGQVMMRDTHTGKWKTALAGYSRARWVDLEIFVVPTLESLGKSFVFSYAWVNTNNPPASLGSLYSTGTFNSVTLGSTETMPAAFSIPCPFTDARASTLIFPSPIEMGHARFVYHVDVGSMSDQELDLQKDEPLLKLFMRGHVEVGGSS